LTGKERGVHGDVLPGQETPGVFQDLRVPRAPGQDGDPAPLLQDLVDRLQAPVAPGFLERGRVGGREIVAVGGREHVPDRGRVPAGIGGRLDRLGGHVRRIGAPAPVGDDAWQ
jgi:hypothetical protein